MSRPNARRQVGAVLRKELVDGVRDKRSMASALLFPILMPVLMGGLIAVMTSKLDRELDSLAVAGAERAPDLVEYLERGGVEVRVLEGDAREAVESGDESLVLSISESFDDDLAEGRRLSAELISDSSLRESLRQGRQARSLVEGWARELGAMRLLMRGIRPEVAHPLSLQSIDTASPEASAARVFDFIPLLLVISAFIGGLNVAIDATAGERERRSLEPLLLNPAPRRLLVTGKWLAASCFAALGAVMTMVSTFVVLQALPRLGYPLPAAPPQASVAGLLAAVVPLALLAAAVEMLVSTYARSFKEAQTYASFLLFLPMLPSFLLQVNDVDPELWMTLVPGLAQHLIVAGVVAGEGVGTTFVAAAALACLGWAVLSVAATTRLLGQEKIVFGR